LNLAKRENGKIELRFLDDQVGADFRQFETIVYFPESFAESTEGFDLYSSHQKQHDPASIGHQEDGPAFATGLSR
jgi:two-component system chemotaxis sensor kinase CheA